jgi:ferredoxin
MRRCRFRGRGRRLHMRGLRSLVSSHYSRFDPFNSAYDIGGLPDIPHSIPASGYASVRTKKHSAASVLNNKGIYHVDTSQCIGCGLCTQVCRAGAIQIINGTAQIDAQLCIGCGACSNVCPQDCVRPQRITLTQSSY